MKVIDGIELLKKYRDGEIDYDTKIKSISSTGNEYYMYIGRGTDKILYGDGSPVSTGYLTNIGNTFEIIEEEKEIEHYDMFDYFTGYEFGGTDKGLLEHLEKNFENINHELAYLIEVVNEIKKEGK